MEREKMIETILRYMCPFFSVGMCRGECNGECNNDCIKRSFAKDAVNELIPDSAVVLTKEEYERLQRVENDLQRYTIELYNRARKAEDKIEQARKDTAMAFANALKKVFIEQKSRFDKIVVQEQKTYKYLKDEDDKVHVKQIEDNANGQAVMAEKAIVYIDKLLKENFGVEVEE